MGRKKQLTLGNNLDPLLKNLPCTGCRMHRANGHHSHHSLCILSSEVQRYGTSHRMTNDNGFGDLQPVQHFDHIISNAADTLVQPRKARAPGAVRVNDHASVAGCEVWQDREEIVLRGSQPVDEDEREASGRRACRVGVGVVEALLVDGDVGHVEECCKRSTCVVAVTDEREGSKGLLPSLSLSTCVIHTSAVVYPMALRFMAASDIRPAN